MGIFSSSTIHNENPQLRAHEKFFSSLGLYVRDVRKLFHKVFQRLDTRNEGVVPLVEILVFFNLERTPFVERLFLSVAAASNNAQLIDFKTFVIVIWNICTLNTADLGCFAIQYYSGGNLESVISCDVCTLIREIYGDKYQTNPFATGVIGKLLQQYGETGVLNDQNIKHCEQNAAITHPLYQLRNSLVIKSLGARVWGRLRRRRVALLGDTIISKLDLVRLHIVDVALIKNKQLYFPLRRESLTMTDQEKMQSRMERQIAAGKRMSAEIGEDTDSVHSRGCNKDTPRTRKLREIERSRTDSQEQPSRSTVSTPTRRRSVAGRRSIKQSIDDDLFEERKNLNEELSFDESTTPSKGSTRVSGTIVVTDRQRRASVGVIDVSMSRRPSKSQETSPKKERRRSVQLASAKIA